MPKQCRGKGRRAEVVTRSSIAGLRRNRQNVSRDLVIGQVLNAELSSGITERHWQASGRGVPPSTRLRQALNKAAHVVRDQQGQTWRPLCIKHRLSQTPLT